MRKFHVRGHDVQQEQKQSKEEKKTLGIIQSIRQFLNIENSVYWNAGECGKAILCCVAAFFSLYVRAESINAQAAADFLLSQSSSGCIRAVLWLMVCR